MGWLKDYAVSKQGVRNAVKDVLDFAEERQGGFLEIRLVFSELPGELRLDDRPIIRRQRKRKSHHFINAYQSAPYRIKSPAAQTRHPTRRHRVIADFFGEFVGDLKRTKRDIEESALELTQARTLPLDLRFLCQCWESESKREKKRDK
jgi:hypothetical protein